MRGRTLLVGVVSALLGVALMSGLARVSGRRTFGTGRGPPMTWLFDAAERARCEAAPGTWTREAPGPNPIWAYDPALRRSHNPQAPELSPEAWQALEQNDLVVDLRGLARGGSFAMRVAPSGPCAVLAAAWSPLYPMWKVYLPVAICALLAALISGLISSRLLVQPLARRVASVRVAASRLGIASGYLPAAEREAAGDDLGQLAQALDQAHLRIRSDAAELERQRKALQHHIADVAHDLRTPLASLQLALQQAAVATVPAAPAGAGESPLLRAIEDVVYIGGLVANLRLASELRGPGVSVAAAPVSLGDIVERAALRLQFLARQKGIALEVSVPELPVWIQGDPIAVEQAVANVIENAVSHNASGAHVAVLLDAGPKAFTLVVRDDGPGVEPADLSRLVERSFRAGRLDAARHRDGRGEGLGLAITHEVCRRHGWRLGFAREEPSGLRVTLEGDLGQPRT